MNPFEALNLFGGGGGGGGEQPPEEGKKQKKKKGDRVQAALPTYLPELQKRSPQEVTELVGHWKEWLHPRADDFFRLDRVLTKIAKYVSKGNDPVTSGIDDCIFWHGDVSDENGVYEGVIEIDRDGHVQKQTVFINRLLVFLFATEDSFEQLMKLPKAPFRMACGHQLCINLAHIDTQAEDSDASKAKENN
jgi:hypothetical protein